MNTLIPFFVSTPEAVPVATEIFKLSEMNTDNTDLWTQTMVGKQPAQ